MTELKDQMDREAEMLTPSPASYRSVLDRVRSRERRRRLFVSVLALAVTAAGSIGLWATLRSRPVPPVAAKGSGTKPAGGTIFFLAHGADRLARIYRVAADGKHLAVIMIVREARSAAVSPTGRLVAYVPRASSEIRVVGIGGTGDHQLVPEASVPEGYTSGTEVDGWSPDGRRLLFERNNDIHVVDVSTGRVTPLTHTPRPMRIRIDDIGEPIVRPSAVEEGGAAWSPDGQSIAFIRGGSLAVMRADGTGAHVVLDLSDRIIRGPAWSPDGSTLAFSTLQLAGTYPIGCAHGGGVYVVKAEGSALLKLTGSACDGDVSWSPRGDRVLFTSGTEAVTMAPTGTDRQTIARNAIMAVWSPDGGHIAYVSENPRALWVIGVDGSGRRRFPIGRLTVEEAALSWTSLAT